MTTPPPGPTTARSAVVRCALVDAEGRILLMNAHDPHAGHPDTWWELPGCQLRPDTTGVDTAVQQLITELGLPGDNIQISDTAWHRQIRPHRPSGDSEVTDETILLADLDLSEPAVAPPARYLAARWWPVDEIVSGSARFYPSLLPTLLVAFLDGQHIDEPVDVWP